MIDLDHNAGGRVRGEVAAALAAWLAEPHGNPASPHQLGRSAREAIDAARAAVAALVGAQASSVVFMSGATEANNHIVAATRGHVVTSVLEHPSLTRALAASSGREVTALRGDGFGRITSGEVVAALRPDTGLLSVAWASGETGTIQDIASLVAAARATRSGELLIHSDAAQAAGWLPITFQESGIDALTLSGHKLGAPSGIGALVLSDRLELPPLLRGGSQEDGRRAGTPNVLGIVGFGVAARLAAREREERARQVARELALLWELLVAGAAPIERLDPAAGLPGTLAVSFPDLRGDLLVIALDLEGLCVSTGPACAAGGAERSPALRALGLSEASVRGALRLSLGAPLGAPQIQEVAGRIARVVARARARAAGRAA